MAEFPSWTSKWITHSVAIPIVCIYFSVFDYNLLYFYRRSEDGKTGKGSLFAVNMLIETVSIIMVLDYTNSTCNTRQIIFYNFSTLKVKFSMTCGHINELKK